MASMNSFIVIQEHDTEDYSKKGDYKRILEFLIMYSLP